MKTKKRIVIKKIKKKELDLLVLLKKKNDARKTTCSF